MASMAAFDSSSTASRFPQHGIDELGGRHPVDPRQPPGHAGAQSIEHQPIFVTERFACWRPLGGLGTAWLGEDGGGDGWRQARKGGIRNPHDTRAEKRGSTQIGERIGQVPEQADCILNLIGVEEAKAFVHIGPHAAAIERRLIFTVAVARSEQDCDIGRPNRPREAGRTIPYRRAREEAHDLTGHAAGRCAHRFVNNEAERRLGARRRANWKSVAFVVPKCMVSHCACICLLDDRPKDIVDECDQRRRRSEADRDGAARIALDPELFDELSGLVEQGDVGIPEGVNRLLPIADNEDRRRQGVAGEAEPFTPALHELGDELPLGAARVLELVDEHVAVPGFEAVPALRELVHLLQQPDCPLEHAGKIDERVAVERALVLPQRNREDTPQSARHDDVQVATERPDGLRDPRRERLRGLTMPPPGVFSVAIGSREAGTHEVLAARLTVLLEEVGAQPIDQPAQRRLSGAARQVAVSARAQADDVAGEHRKLRMPERTIRDTCAIRMIDTVTTGSTMCFNPRVKSSVSGT